MIGEENIMNMTKPAYDQFSIEDAFDVLMEKAEFFVQNNEQTGGGKIAEAVDIIRELMEVVNG
jgi:hypothetical protein